MRLHSRISRLEANQPPDPSTSVMPPQNRAAVDHLFRLMESDPKYHDELAEINAEMEAFRQRRACHA